MENISLLDIIESVSASVESEKNLSLEEAIFKIGILYGQQTILLGLCQASAEICPIERKRIQEVALKNYNSTEKLAKKYGLVDQMSTFFETYEEIKASCNC